jgi:ligand-binding sensor domain-containing protein
MLLSLVGIAGALEPATPLAGYARQSWVMENGLPQNTVQAMTQTRDGFIWLGTEVGLVRFDGTSFAVFDKGSKPALPGNDVRCLLAASDGTLWIGTSDGLARWKDGAVRSFGSGDGLPDSSVLRMIEDVDGKFWVLTNQGPAYLSGDRFRAQSNFAATSSRLGHFLAGGEQFDEALPHGVIARGGRNSVVLTGSHAGTPAELGVGKELPGTRIQVHFEDREGALWIGTNGGLVRYANGKLDKLPVTDPLADASVLSIMEDSEGDLWVGTESGGLQILRDQRFRTLTTRDGLSSDNTTAVVEDGAGTLWVGTAGNGVTALGAGDSSFPGSKSGTQKTYTVREGLLSDVILSLAAAPNGDLWVGTPDGLSRIRRGVVTSFTSADGLPDDFIRSLLADSDGSLWIGTRRGLTHWGGSFDAVDAGAHMQTYTHANGLGSDLVGAMVRDSAGDLWVATFAGLSRLHGGTITNFTTANGLSSNVITALLAREHGTLLVGTQDHGWNLWNGQQFVAADSGLEKTTVHAILDDGRGHLWFATGNGIARCDCSQNKMGMPSADCAHWIEFTTADGLRSRETATNSHPSAWRTRDGRLWFATPKGLVEIDPSHFPVNSVAPPVALERFAVDDVDQPLEGAGNQLRVPSGHVHFQFDYAGLSFAAPQKVRYRYMLEGFDHTWTEAGARRTAYYTNIPPGHYTFRVQAANNDGVWNTQGAGLTFELRPHFYQTVWFYMGLAVCLAGLVVLFLRLRLLRAERDFRAVLGERNRIAREIHDTLAQGYVGISVQLEVLSELLRHGRTEIAAKQLDTTRGYVREGLADARQSIWALRSQDAGETTLPVRMRRLVEQSDGLGLEAKFSIYGAYRPLPPGTEQEFLRVAQEAIHNVKKHAAARNLMVQMEYTSAGVALEVRDDGSGFDAASDAKAGHYGLTGMRERAAAIGGSLEVISKPGAGTTVRLQAPAPQRLAGVKE